MKFSDYADEKERYLVHTPSSFAKSAYFYPGIWLLSKLPHIAVPVLWTLKEELVNLSTIKFVGWIAYFVFIDLCALLGTLLYVPAGLSTILAEEHTIRGYLAMIVYGVILLMLLHSYALKPTVESIYRFKYLITVFRQKGENLQESKVAEHSSV